MPSFLPCCCWWQLCLQSWAPGQKLPLSSCPALKAGPSHELRREKLPVQGFPDANLLSSLSVSKADCYVALDLPTASPVTSRTQVVYNSSDPEWNETFEYKIHSAVKVRWVSLTWSCLDYSIPSAVEGS
uniref:C2 domain-containing protein n=1 Tax=Gopherus agassizii TaxID=38772 RepID=A0A452GNP3_9SAUR